MDIDKKINRVLAGLSHTGYTTEIEKCEARILIEELFNQVKKQQEVIDKATNDIQEIIDNINDKTIISLGQFVPELEIIQDELGGSNDILKEVSE
mgnify:CR=1 FL=1